MVFFCVSVAFSVSIWLQLPISIDLSCFISIVLCPLYNNLVLSSLNGILSLFIKFRYVTDVFDYTVS